MTEYIIPPDDDFTKICIYILSFVVAFVAVLFTIVVLSSCDIQKDNKFLKEIIIKDKVEIKHIMADDLHDVADEVDKEYQEKPKEDQKEES